MLAPLRAPHSEQPRVEAPKSGAGAVIMHEVGDFGPVNPRACFIA